MPGEVYKLADYNIAVTSQPHSEVAALAITIHDLQKGEELKKVFGDYKLRIVPSANRKAGRTEIVKIEYEDTFVKVAGLIGGPDYVRVARALLNNENATDEEIASATGLKIKTVRKALYDLFGRSLISGIRVRDPKRGWFVYRWKAQRDQTDGFIQTQKKKILNRLKQRLDHEETREFYFCGTPTCLTQDVRGGDGDVLQVPDLPEAAQQDRQHRAEGGAQMEDKPARRRHHDRKVTASRSADL